jgi:type IV secretion system protein VirB4
MFKTTSGAPYYFNFHKGEEGLGREAAAKMDPNHKDLANTVVIGKSGTGKTVLEMMLAGANAEVQPARKGKVLSCVLFDKDLGAAVGVRAMGGRYYPLKNGVPSGFNPFQMEPTPNNLTFLESLSSNWSSMTACRSRRSRSGNQPGHQGVMGAAKPKRRIGPRCSNSWTHGRKRPAYPPGEVVPRRGAGLVVRQRRRHVAPGQLHDGWL